jgi:hypothetical protein
MKLQLSIDVSNSYYGEVTMSTFEDLSDWIFEFGLNIEEFFVVCLKGQLTVTIPSAFEI